MLFFWEESSASFSTRGSISPYFRVVGHFDTLRRFREKQEINIFKNPDVSIPCVLGPSFPQQDLALANKPTFVSIFGTRLLLLLRPQINPCFFLFSYAGDECLSYTMKEAIWLSHYLLIDD
jgi:hypothetical protein